MCYPKARITIGHTQAETSMGSCLRKCESVATQLHHYLHNPYTIMGLNKIYLGPYLSTACLPSIIKFLPTFHYPPLTSSSPNMSKFHPPKHLATGYDNADWDENIEVVPAPMPMPSVLAPKYTDVRLKDNPSLQQSWKTSDNSTSSKSSVPKPVHHPKSKSQVIDPIPVPKPRSQPITPLLEIDTTQPSTPVPSRPATLSLLDTDVTHPSFIPSFLSLDIPCPPSLSTRPSISTHTSETPKPAHKYRTYACQICGPRCTRLKSHVLELHLSYYVSPLTTCFECKENFSMESCLQRHLSQH